MKLFQQLLVAPAALGLMAPMAANAADLNISGMSGYSDSASQAYSSSNEQVTSIDQFSDIYQTDWAYQALSNLVERYGCVAGYPSGSYKGNRAMTRYEAAALLNACLDRVTEVTDELRRLLNEFETELSVIRGRVDGLEARVGELEATQFSTTTKMSGEAFFVVGANSFSGNAEQGAVDAIFFTGAFYSDEDFNNGDVGTNRSKAAAAVSGATAFNYDYRLYLDTSFTGKDLLHTRLRAGNFGGSPYGYWRYVGLDSLEVAYEGSSADVIGVDRIFYQFPVGEDFKATFGALVRQDDMLAVWPSAYPADTILDLFTYAGAPGAYNMALGGGGGFQWEQNGWSLSASYLSTNASNGNPEAGGLATDGAGSNGTAQVAYTEENWGLAAAYNYASGDNGAGLYSGNGTPLANYVAAIGITNSVGLSAWWSPEETGWMPSISAGWGFNNNDRVDDEQIIRSATSQSWYIGLQWQDAFIEGNVFGMAVGQPTFVTNIDYSSSYEGGDDFVADGNYAWEWWYKFQVTDNISVTPAVYYLSRPYGDLTDGRGSDLGGNRNDDTFSNFGGVIKTTFKF